ncbi:MAG: aspartate carbamoyltransferase, partial [Pseudomonadales bacterium]
RMPEYIEERLRKAGHRLVVTENLEEGIHNAQIVYSTRIQEERFTSSEEADLYRGRFRINQAIYTANCQPNTVIMHPLPRDSRAEANELDGDLDANPNLAIFRQADNGVLVRMALFALILKVDHLMEKYEHEVSWFTRK